MFFFSCLSNVYARAVFLLWMQISLGWGYAPNDRIAFSLSFCQSVSCQSALIRQFAICLVQLLPAYGSRPPLDVVIWNPCCSTLMTAALALTPFCGRDKKMSACNGLLWPTLVYGNATTLDVHYALFVRHELRATSAVNFKTAVEILVDKKRHETKLGLL